MSGPAPKLAPEPNRGILQALPPMTPFFRLPRFAALLALALLAAWPAQGQIGVKMQIKRRLFMINEPILATVTISNLAGKELMLADTQEGGQWFSFQIVSTDGRIVSPRDAKYELQPLALHPGETVKRTVNLNELYALGDFGSYHVKASIYFAEVGKYFGSNGLPLELTDGQAIWKQTVGAPDAVDGDNYRTFTLLTMEEQGTKLLYVRLQGQNDGRVYACYNLGRMIAGFQPDAKFDAGNNLAVLHLIGPKTFSLARIGIDGKILSQDTYVTPKTQPYLRKANGGALQLVGAVKQDPRVAQAKPTDNVPKVSDRPPGF